MFLNVKHYSHLRMLLGVRSRVKSSVRPEDQRSGPKESLRGTSGRRHGIWTERAGSGRPAEDRNRQRKFSIYRQLGPGGEGRSRPRASFEAKRPDGV